MSATRPLASPARRRYSLSLSLGLFGLGLGAAARATPGRAALAPPDQGAKYQVLHHFHAGARVGGTVPAGVIQGIDGRLYGTTITGGPHDQGTVYTFSDSEGFATLYGFEVDAGGATAPLLQGPDGALYGTTYGDYFSSTLRGTVFRVDLDGRYTRLHDFTGGGGDGALPKASLMLAGDGHFYGTTSAGGDWGQGTVFRMTPQGRVETLWSLDGRSEGGEPSCELLQADDGHLYGTTSSGGRRGGGTIFRLTLDGQFTLMHAFRENSGWRPTAGLIQATDGELYGITAAGGYQPSNGSLFKITPDGAFTVLKHLRSKRGPIGCRSTAGLIQGRDGGLYGTTTMGSRNDTGSAFRMLGDELQALHRFQDTPGYQDRSALLEATDGALYGTSSQDGLYGRGTLYRLSTR